jgi:hypothetical protein
MAEKVIAEIRFIETDDGFRIETKGDKEHLRKMGFGPGMRHWRRAYKSWMRGRGPGFRPPWMWGDWDEVDEDEDVSAKSEEI